MRQWIFLGAALLAGSFINGSEAREVKRALSAPPDGMSKTVISAATDPEGAGLEILVVGPHRRITLPVGQPLPDGATSIGLWMTELKGSEVRFVIRDGTDKRVLDAGYREGMTPGPKQGSWVSHQAGLGDWHLQKTFLKKPAKNLVLDSIEIERSKPGKELRVGPLVISDLGADPFEARRVWKLKDYETPKPDSTFWTGNRFYEYGFETDPLLRRSVWRFLLPAKTIASLRLVLRSMTGAPQWHATISGPLLDQPIPLPDMAEGCMLLDVTAFDAEDRLAGSTRLVYQTLRSDAPPPPLPGDLDAWPWSLKGLQLGGQAARRGEPLSITINADKLLKCHPSLSLYWQVTDHAGSIHGEGREAFANEAATITLPSSRTGGYNLSLRFEDKQGPVDEVRYTYGIADSSAPSQTMATDSPPNGPLLLNQTKVHHDADHFQRLPTDSLPAIADWTFQSGMSPCFLIFWGEIEPVEGCYNWHIIDHYLDLAKEGRKVALGINFSGDNLPEWLWFEELMSQGQQTIHHNYHYSTPFGPRFQKAHAKLWRAILERYRNDPRIAAWIYQAGPSEGFVTDTPPKIADYSPEAVAAFQKFLGVKYGDIQKLNAAWHSDHTAFSKIRPPLPDFSKVWESSPRWWDFHLFKTSFVPEYLERIQSAARAIDPSRPMIMYAKEGFGAPGLLGPVFRKNHFTYSNGGGESQGSFVQSSLMRRFDVPVMSENGHPLPPSVATASSMCAFSILAGGFTGQMLQSGLVWTKVEFPDAPEYEAVGKLMKSLSLCAGELSQTTPAVNWAGYYSATTEFLQSRSMRCRLYPSVLALFDAAQTRLNNSCSWVDDSTPLDILQTTPFIVDGGSKILAPDAVENLLRYVENGGVYVCETTTGLYEPGTESPTNRLLGRLGAKPSTMEASPLQVAAPEGSSLSFKNRMGLSWEQELPVRAIISDEKGTPVVWERTWGKGKFLILGGEINWPASSDWLGLLVNTYAGHLPYRIEGDNSICGTLKGPGADYAVIRPLLSDKNGKEKNDVRLEDILKAKKARVRITGIPKTAKCEELIGGYAITHTDEGIELEVPRGLFAVIRIPKTPSSVHESQGHGILLPPGGSSGSTEPRDKKVLINGHVDSVQPKAWDGASSVAVNEQSELIRNLEAGKPQTLVFYGTSLSCGNWTKQAAEILQARYGNLIAVHNCAKGGQDSTWGLQNVETLVVPLKPDTVTIEFSMNDAISQRRIPVDKARENLLALIDALKRDNPEVEIILLTMNPVGGDADSRPKNHPFYRGGLPDYYQMVRDVGASSKLHLIDLHAVWSDWRKKNPEDFETIVPDGVHPNETGCREVILPAFLAGLGQITALPQKAK